ncbi:hypothetical protein K438DRAFT_1972242 [Mycena galopus ATCC 62051]|nr:hypothetical protein K438DRAFT_1972242 [Mycena galopus ATCC 62051]
MSARNSQFCTIWHALKYAHRHWVEGDCVRVVQNRWIVLLRARSLFSDAHDCLWRNGASWWLPQNPLHLYAMPLPHHCNARLARAHTHSAAKTDIPHHVTMRCGLLAPTPRCGCISITCGPSFGALRCAQRRRHRTHRGAPSLLGSWIGLTIAFAPHPPPPAPSPIHISKQPLRPHPHRDASTAHLLLPAAAVHRLPPATSPLRATLQCRAHIPPSTASCAPPAGPLTPLHAPLSPACSPPPPLADSRALQVPRGHSLCVRTSDHPSTPHAPHTLIRTFPTSPPTPRHHRSSCHPAARRLPPPAFPPCALLPILCPISSADLPPPRHPLIPPLLVCSPPIASARRCHPPHVHCAQLCGAQAPHCFHQRYVCVIRSTLLPPPSPHALFPHPARSPTVPRHLLPYPRAHQHRVLTLQRLPRPLTYPNRNVSILTSHSRSRHLSPHSHASPAARRKSPTGTYTMYRVPAALGS